MGMLSLIVGIFIFIIPIVIVALIIVAVVKKNKDGQTTNFENIVRNLYVYTMLIILLFTMIGSVIVAFNGITDYLIPETTFEKEDDFTEVEKLEYEIELAEEKSESFVMFFSSMSLIIILIPLFTYHNKIAKELKNTV